MEDYVMHCFDHPRASGEEARALCLSSDGVESSCSLSHALDGCLGRGCADADGGDDGGGWQGWHCEGSLLVTLFGILFWDVIFEEVDGVF